MQDTERLSQIICQCQQGSHKAYAELLELYGNRLFAYFFRLTGNEVVSNDLLSELFLKLVTKINCYKTGSFNFWLFKIASNIFYDHLRALQREKALLKNKQITVQEVCDIPDETFDAETIDNLGQMLLQLDDSTREMVMLRFYSQLSFKEIAELKSEPLGTVLSKVHRGLAKLRQLMETKT